MLFAKVQSCKNILHLNPGPLSYEAAALPIESTTKPNKSSIGKICIDALSVNREDLLASTYVGEPKTRLLAVLHLKNQLFFSLSICCRENCYNIFLKLFKIKSFISAPWCLLGLNPTSCRFLQVCLFYIFFMWAVLVDCLFSTI